MHYPEVFVTESLPLIRDPLIQTHSARVEKHAKNATESIKVLFRFLLAIVFT